MCMKIKNMFIFADNTSCLRSEPVANKAGSNSCAVISFVSEWELPIATVCDNSCNNIESNDAELDFEITSRKAVYERVEWTCPVFDSLTI